MDGWAQPLVELATDALLDQGAVVVHRPILPRPPAEGIWREIVASGDTIRHQKPGPRPTPGWRRRGSGTMSALRTDRRWPS
jgi:hypothetical protein